MQPLQYWQRLVFGNQVSLARFAADSDTQVPNPICFLPLTVTPAHSHRLRAVSHAHHQQKLHIVTEQGALHPVPVQPRHLLPSGHKHTQLGYLLTASNFARPGIVLEIQGVAVI